MGKSSKKHIGKEISIAQAYFVQAEEFRLNNNHKEAIDSYLHSILMNRNNAASYLGLAISYKNLKNYDKAVINLQKAEKLQPADIRVQKELALCNIIRGDFETGIKHLRTSIRLDPQNVEVHMQLALVHEMIEETDMALMIYQKIIETNPEYLRAYIQKATLYMHLEDYLDSARVFRKVLRLKPDYYRACLAIGICYEKLSNTSGAKRFYRKYMNLAKNTLNSQAVSQRIKELETNNRKERRNLRVL